jgi:hypothetical protein
MITDKLKQLAGFDPETANIWQRLKPRSRAGFLWAFFTGTAAHIFYFTSRYINEDSIKRLIVDEPVTISGRWLTNILNDTRFGYSPPIVAGMLTVLFIAIAAALVCEILDINGKWPAGLTGALMASYPTVAYTNGYIFTTDVYFLAMLLATLAVLCAQKTRLAGVISGAICLALSLAIYQAYLTVALTLCIASIILLILEPSSKLQDALKLLGRYFGMGVLGYALYYISVQISLKITGLELTGYQGLDQMGSISITGLPSAVKAAYKGVAAVYTGRVYPLPGFVLAALAITAVIALFIAALKVINIRKSPGKLILLAVLLPLCPPAIYIMPVLMPAVSLNPLVMYAFVLPFIIVLALMKNLPPFSGIAKTAVLSALLIVAGYHLIFSNIYYLKLDLFYERTYSLYTRILARAEPLLEPGRKMAVLGRFPTENYPNSTFMFSETTPDQGIWGQFIGLNHTDYAVNIERFNYFADSALGVPLNAPEDDEIERLSRLAADMPVWPKEGSVALIGDTVVVNLGAAVIDHEALGGGRYGFTVKLPVADPDLYQCSWHLWRDGVLTAELSASPDKYVEFDLSKAGMYRVQCYYKLPDGSSVTVRLDNIVIQ